MCAVPSMAILCRSLISCLPDLVPRYCLNHFEMVPVATITTGITFARKIHMRWIYIMRSSYFKIFSASFLITFLSRGIAASINMRVPFLLSWIMMSGLLLGMILSDNTCWFHNMVILPSWLVSTDFGTSSYQCSLSNFTSISLRMLLYHVSVFVLLLPILGMVKWCVLLSHQIFTEPAFAICCW